MFTDREAPSLLDTCHLESRVPRPGVEYPTASSRTRICYPHLIHLSTHLDLLPSPRFPRVPPGFPSTLTSLELFEEPEDEEDAERTPWKAGDDHPSWNPEQFMMSALHDLPTLDSLTAPAIWRSEAVTEECEGFDTVLIWKE